MKKLFPRIFFIPKSFFRESDNDKKSDKSKGEGESASSSAHSAASVVDKLNKTMFHKLQEIEAKRERTTALERKIFKMVDGPKKKAIVYQKQQGAML